MIERLEPRALLTTTLAYNGSYMPDSTTQADGVNGSWSSSGASSDGSGLVVAGDWDPTPSQTLTLSGLPAHTMARIVVQIPEFGTWMTGDDTEKLTVSAGTEQSIERSHDQSSPDDYATLVQSSPNFGRWFASSGSTLTVTISAEDYEAGETEMCWGVTVSTYEPTITASGGGSMTEAGSGSGSATFTVERDLPAGYGGPSAGDDPVPETTVNVIRGGTATFGADYQAAPGYNDLPDGEVSIPEGVQVSKTFQIVPIDDSVAEPSTPPATGPIEPETVTWEVQIPDAPTPAEEEVTLTASIVDDTTWRYDKTWTVVDKPIDHPAERLNSYTVPNGSGFGGLGYTDTYWLVSEWRPITGAQAESPHFGDSASYNTSFSWGTTKTAGWDIGGSAGASLDLKDWISVPINITGNFKVDYTTSNGGSTTLPGYAGGMTNKLINIAGYGLYQYIVTIRDIPDQYTSSGGASVHVPASHGEEGPHIELGWTGLTSVAYKATMTRHWLDEEASGADTFITAGPVAPSPGNFRPSNYPT